MSYFAIIKVAFITFPLLAVFLTIPYMVFQYHRFGTVSKVKTLIFATFIFYLLCAYYLVILPLPAHDSLTHGVKPQLVPFSFIFAFLHETKLNITAVSTYLPALKQSVVLQPLFNIFLTMPLGIYLAAFFKKSFKKVIIIGFLCSLFFELTQLTGIYGLYQYSYRLFDVDDLMLNTLGTIIGYLIGKKLSFIPSKESLDNESIDKRIRITYLRRFVAFIADYIIVLSLTTIFNLVSSKLFDHQITGLTLNMINMLLLFSYLVVSNTFFKASLGKRLVHLKLNNNSFGKVSFRYFLMFLVLPNIGIMALLMNYFNTNINFILYLIIIINMLWSLKKKKHLFYENISSCSNELYLKKAKVKQP